MMKSNSDLLRVDGPEIVNGRGEIVRLRGFFLGSWMCLENFMLGYPGHATGVRAAVASVLGQAKAEFFFERFLQHFFTEDDLRFIKSLGMNTVRIPLNYRHFESDDRPFEYKSEGFALLDKVIGWARAHQMYVILDLLAVQGWQSGDWPSDNPCQGAHLWGQKVFEDRLVAFWGEIARRYRDEPFVAGYDIMNEPDTKDVDSLNRLYRRVTAAIRAIDTEHIIFLEGNRYARVFEGFDAPFDANTVYSSHVYAAPGMDDGEYPGYVNATKQDWTLGIDIDKPVVSGQCPDEISVEFFDRERLEREYLEQNTWVLEHGGPLYVGEFGCIFNDGKLNASRLRFMADMIDIMEKHGHHWSICTYKDIGWMGTVYVDPDSEWMQRTRPVRELKTALRCDYHIERHDSEIGRLIHQMVVHTREVLADCPMDCNRLRKELLAHISGLVLSQLLLPAFAEQFRGMSEDEIDQMMQSFSFQNCVQREDMVQLIRDRLLGGVESQ